MHIIRGKVYHGKKRGKRLGFPTANIKLSKKIPQGIYVSETTFDNQTFQSATFIGNAKTFGENEVFAETYILDFDQEIYNKEIAVRLIKKIRNNEKFVSEQKLVEQIKKDVEMAREYFRDSEINSE